MMYDPGMLQAALTAAVGDDPQLIAELRLAFHDSAGTMLEQLKGSRSDGNWRMAALRLQGLAGTFGSVALMDAAARALESAPGDPVALRQIIAAIDSFDS